MLIDRQLRVFTELCHGKEEFITATTLSLRHGVSVRTIQSDLAEVRSFVSKLDFLEFISVPSKGSQVQVLDEERYQQFINELQHSNRYQFATTKKDRIYKIIALLFNTKKYISVQHLADRLFVSKSTLLTDLKQAKELLKKYNIELQNKPQYGICVSGSESAIRTCIIKENIDILFTYNDFLKVGQYSDQLPKIGDILVNCLTDYKFRISDIALQNLIIHLDIMIRRIRLGFILDHLEPSWNDLELSHELEIAKDIFSDCERIFQVDTPKSEIYCLAIYLKGKSDYADHTYITEEIDDFVYDALTSIKMKFGIDLIDHVQLRISLSLHLVPLLMRLKYNMQLKNELLQGVHKSFQLAMDIATSFAYQIKETYEYTLIEDEIAYFAIYFNSALNSYLEARGSNSLLIISSLKRSETLLLRERINLWFANQISELHIVDCYDVSEELLAQYNVVCTTMRNDFFEMNDTILISQFPTEDDYRNIKMALDGFKGKHDILSLFQQKKMFIGKAKNKDEVIRRLSTIVQAHEPLAAGVENEVLRREVMGGTYFGNQVAIPHPLHPITHDTHIAVALLEQDVLWDNQDHRVRVVLLVCLEKDNPRAFQIWSYLSEFINNEQFIKSILEDMSYENFMRQLSIILDTINWRLRDY